MPFSWKGFFPLFSKFIAPFAESAIRNAKISGYLCFTLSTCFEKYYCLLLEFLGVGRLRFAHKTLLVLVYHISLLRPPNFGGIPHATRSTSPDRSDGCCRSAASQYAFPCR